MLLFDCDGTVVDSETLAYKAFRSVSLAMLGLSITQEMWSQHFLGHSRNTCLEVLSHWCKGLPEDFAVTLARTLRTSLENELVEVAGIRAALEAISIPKAIVSNASLAHVGFVLTKTELSHHFHHVCSSGSQGLAPKPAPDIYLHAISTLGVQGTQCIVVEDSLPGVVAAKAAGLKTIAFASQVTAAELENVGADFVISSMVELPCLIQRWTNSAV
ncbi:HAD family phosphatase [Pseudomonas sp. B21-048]|uniref:HAD family hydrolase n=1 Tax=Pseudomonas sp. B21-048 TaxID=2895490 RepID=UPI00215EAF79|nr:HAD family phosphatase [Pseudomonas sp. B21-048]UVK97646.1 HAD family phosphatase [Pseudomonas sp. B21-048]